MLPKLPNIKLEKILRVVPPLENANIIQEKGIRHVVLFSNQKIIENAILLGKIEEFTPGSELLNANVWMDISKPKIILIFGRRGSGKSYDLGIIVEGLAIHNNKIKIGDYCPPILIFDPLNQFWTLNEIPSPEDIEEKTQIKLLQEWGLISSAIPKIRIFIPKGTPKIHPNVEEFAINVSEMTVDDWCCLFKVDKYMDLTGQLINSAYRKVTKTGYDTGRRHIPPKEEYTIQDLIECIENDLEINDRDRGFSRQTCRAVLVRLREIDESPLFKGESIINIKEIFKPGQVSLFMLKGVDESTRSLIVSILTRKLMKARSIAWENEGVAKKLITKSRLLEKTNPKEAELLREKAKMMLKEAKEYGVSPGWIVIDEAHVLCPTEGYSPAKEILIEYVKQGRAMGLSLIAATQQPSALSNSLISQRDLILVHQLGIKSDIDAAFSQMNPNFPSEIIIGKKKITSYIPYFLINSLSKGEAILSTDEQSRNFIIKMRPRVSSHGGKEPIFK